MPVTYIYIHRHLVIFYSSMLIMRRISVIHCSFPNVYSLPITQFKKYNYNYYPWLISDAGIKFVWITNLHLFSYSLCKINITFLNSSFKFTYFFWLNCKIYIKLFIVKWFYFVYNYTGKYYILSINHWYWYLMYRINKGPCD